MPILPHKGIWPIIAAGVFIAPGAMVIGAVTLHEGVSVWYNAVIRGDTDSIEIGRNTNIQDNCTLHTDEDAPLTIGEGCSLGHGAVVHGATLGDNVLVAMNAVVLSHSQVGSNTIIGAGAVVSEHKVIPSGVLALGLPAKAIRSLSDVEQERIRFGANRYRELAEEHREAPQK